MVEFVPLGFLKTICNQVYSILFFFKVTQYFKGIGE